MSSFELFFPLYYKKNGSSIPFGKKLPSVFLFNRYVKSFKNQSPTFSYLTPLILMKPSPFSKETGSSRD